MSETERRVLAETEKFESALPALLPKYGGRWVVFREGAVQADFNNEAEAYTFAMSRFGPDGGAVIAPVVVSSPRPITAGVMYGLA
jgi:hypothetical protein